MSQLSPQALFVGGAGCIVLALAVVVFVLAREPLVPAPQLGLRGLKRHRALAAGGGFAYFEPVMRFCASWIAYLPLHPQRRRADVFLGYSGDYLGLTADEYFATSFLSGVAGFAGGFWLLELDVLVAVAAGVLAMLVPYFAVRGEANRRRLAINRALPAAIDLAALCMSAGLDFPGALRRITEKANPNDPLTEELGRILQEIDLGHARRRVLQTFGQRVESEAVHDFVAAVTQAEAKGNPLAEVLRIQAEVLRRRRSQAAEEAAAAASVKMVGPLVMLLISSLLLVMGPLILKTMTSYNESFSP